MENADYVREQARLHRLKNEHVRDDREHRRRAGLWGVPAIKGISKEALRRRHGDRCCYCGVTMEFTIGEGYNHNPLRASIEHVIPLSLGGAHDWENVRLACMACNEGKSRTRTAEQWLAILAERSVDA
jgi:5-methylcytosine-specific restriction endonuclease McrA